MYATSNTLAAIALAAAVLTPAIAFGQTATETAFESGNIEAGGDGGNNDYYGSGNDDAFGEYGIASFNISPADFGFGADIDDITSAQYTLTFNDRSFSDGDSFELFFSADDFDPTYTGLNYDNSGTNDPSGLVASQYTSLISLGSYALGFDPTNSSLGGMQFTYDLNLGAAEAALIGEINAGSDFQLILVAEDNADDITFSGVGNTFDPGDPTLTLDGTAVPEPTSLALLGLGGFALLRRRRGA